VGHSAVVGSGAAGPVRTLRVVAAGGVDDPEPDAGAVISSIEEQSPPILRAGFRGWGYPQDGRVGVGNLAAV